MVSKEEGLNYGESKIFWSPMRISLIVENIDSKTRDVNIEKRGPRSEANSLAVSGFAKSLGVKVKDLL